MGKAGVVKVFVLGCGVARDGIGLGGHGSLRLGQVERRLPVDSIDGRQALNSAAVVRGGHFSWPRSAVVTITQNAICNDGRRDLARIFQHDRVVGARDRPIGPNGGQSKQGHKSALQSRIRGCLPSWIGILIQLLVA
jgi:hypothetical protein